MRQMAQRVFHFMAAHAFGVVAQGADQRHRVACLQPLQEGIDPCIDNRFRVEHGRLA